MNFSHRKPEYRRSRGDGRDQQGEEKTNDVTNISDFLSSVLLSFTSWHRKWSGKDRAVRSNTAPCWWNPAEGRSLRLSSAVMGKTSHTVLMSQGTKRGFSYKCLCLLKKLMSTGTAAQHHWEESLNLLAKSGFSRTVLYSCKYVFHAVCISFTSLLHSLWLNTK